MVHRMLRIALLLPIVGVVAGCAASTSESTAERERTRTEIAEKLEQPAESTGTEEAREIVASGAWGDLQGRFVFEGTPPTAARISPTKDVVVCGKHDLFNESLVVHPESKGIQNVVVFLYLKKGVTPPIHESYASSSAAKVTLDNEFCRFEPHITVLRTSQTLLVRNLDSVGHNTKIDAISNAAINPLLPAFENFEHVFSKEERLPLPVSCSIHPWMNGYLLVKDHPYITVSNENGEFSIPKLPTGEWTFQVWQEKAKTLQEVKVGGVATEWKRGRFDQVITEGTTDLGEILVSASQLD